MILDFDEILLKLEEVLVRLEVGIRFLQGEQLRQRFLEGVLHLAELTRTGERNGLRPKLGDSSQHTLLVTRIPFDSGDELGNEVMSPLELYVDIGPRRANWLRPHEAINRKCAPCPTAIINRISRVTKRSPFCCIRTCMFPVSMLRKPANRRKAE